MNSELFKVKVADVFKSAAIAVGLAVLALMYGLSQTQGFDVFNADWISIAKMCVNTSFTAFFAVLASIFLSDSEGKLGGKI